ASEKTPTLPSPAGDGGKEAPTLPSPVNGGGKKTSPVEVTEGAELLAKAKGIDLATIKGSGPGGSIRRRDVAEAVGREAPTMPSPVSGGGDKAGVIPLRGAAAALAKYMEESLQSPPAPRFGRVRVA